MATILVLAGTTALAQTVLTPVGKQVLLKLAERDYTAANTLFESMPARDAVAALTPAALRNNTQAQWMLARAYWMTGDQALAGRWAYTARMGTILDATVCADIGARNSDQILAFPYRNMLDAVRRDPIAEQQAVHFASQHYAKSWKRYQDPAWTCRAWQATKGKAIYGQTSEEVRWALQRRVMLESLLRKSGLSALMKEDRNTSTDPLQQDFGGQDDFGAPLRKAKD